jgi:hypothetical protein
MARIIQGFIGSTGKMQHAPDAVSLLTELDSATARDAIMRIAATAKLAKVEHDRERHMTNIESGSDGQGIYLSGPGAGAER